MKKLRITVDGKPYEVTVERLDHEEPERPPTGAIPAPVEIKPPPAKPPSRPPKPPLKSGAISSPMAGVVLSVAVREGDEVKQDQVLLILEAMKMENQIIAPAPASVSKIHVKAGDSVIEGQLLVELS